MTTRVLVGRYELGEVLGEGGMAVVYRAHDRTLGRDVAIKMLRDQYTGDAEFAERFEREARAAARLSHANAVDIYDVATDGATRFIVMELVEGETLKNLVRRVGALPPGHVIHYGREVARALDYAHRRGLVHRDVKPQNVLVDADGHAKLTDFGIAQAAGAISLTQTGSVLGTAQYMSPEQARGQSSGPASDIYSLGVVLYELATGQLPFPADSPLSVALRHVQDEPVPPRRLNPSIPPALEAVILRALAKDPAARFGSATELAEALRGDQDPLRQRTARVAAVTPPDRRSVTERGSANGAAAATMTRPTRVVRADPQGRRPPPPASRSSKGGGTLGNVVLLVLVLASLAALVLGFSFLFGGGGTRTEAAATPTAVAKPTAAPKVAQPEPKAPVATKPAPTPTAVRATATAAPTAAPTATAVPPPTQPPATQAPARVAVPKVTGLSLGAAQQELSGRGLVMEFREASDPKQANNVIIEQSPKDGEQVARGGVVRLVLNKLPTVAVPNVSGLEEAEARKVIEQAGFKIKVERDSGGRKGVVYDQSPAPGIRVPEGTEVRIVLGS